MAINDLQKKINILISKIEKEIKETEDEENIISIEELVSAGEVGDFKSLLIKDQSQVIDGFSQSYELADLAEKVSLGVWMGCIPLFLISTIINQALADKYGAALSGDLLSFYNTVVITQMLSSTGVFVSGNMYFLITYLIRKLSARLNYKCVLDLVEMCYDKKPKSNAIPSKYLKSCIFQNEDYESEERVDVLLPDDTTVCMKMDQFFRAVLDLEALIVVIGEKASSEYEELKILAQEYTIYMLTLSKSQADSQRYLPYFKAKLNKINQKLVSILDMGIENCEEDYNGPILLRGYHDTDPQF